MDDLLKLTPVEKRGEFFFKRDDLFQPFDVPLNGGKVRQCLSLLSNNERTIRQHYNNTVLTVASVHSPQGYLITRCASSLGMSTVIGVGTADLDSVMARRPFRRACKLGARLLSLAKVSYNTVLHCRLKQWSEKEGWFPIPFGLGPNGSKINEGQPSNLPPYLDNLVIPCGAGYAASAILRGLARMDARPKNIYVVQIAGIDRRKAIFDGVDYHFVADPTYPYSKRVKLTYKGLELDSVYESKAFEWVLRTGLKGRTCFWVVGNFDGIRGAM